MNRNVIETALGAVVLLVAIVFIVFAYELSGLKSVDGYRVFGKFNSIDGLTVGSDVRVSGVKVGSVVDLSIDERTYQAVVAMTLRQDVRIPTDTQVEIASEGLLGGKYIRLGPGAASEMLAEGGELKRTEDVVSLEELLGRVIFLVSEETSP